MQSLLSLFYVKAKTSDIYIFLRTTQLPHKDFAPLSTAAIPSHFVKVCFHEKKWSQFSNYSSSNIFDISLLEKVEDEIPFSLILKSNIKCKNSNTLKGDIANLCLSGLGNYFLCHRFIFQTLLWSLEFVILINFQHSTITLRLQQDTITTLKILIHCIV